jgi:hypothetical protein
MYADGAPRDLYVSPEMERQAEYERVLRDKPYCEAVQTFIDSGTLGDGHMGPAAVPYLERIVEASPPEIVDAQRQLLESVRSGAPEGASALRSTQYFTAHC